MCCFSFKVRTLVFIYFYLQPIFYMNFEDYIILNTVLSSYLTKL